MPNQSDDENDKRSAQEIWRQKRAEEAKQQEEINEKARQKFNKKYPEPPQADAPHLPPPPPPLVVPVPQDSEAKEHWSKLIKAYQEQFKKEPTGEHKNELQFDSREQAKEFFEGQAQQNRKFLATYLNGEGQPTDNHIFSFGDGNCYTGTQADIEAALQKDNKTEALAAFKQTLAPAKNPTQAFRKALSSDNPSPSEAYEDNGNQPKP